MKEGELWRITYNVCTNKYEHVWAYGDLCLVTVGTAQWSNKYHSGGFKALVLRTGKEIELSPNVAERVDEGR